MTVATFASNLRGHHGLWFVDNTASLMTLVKGRSPTVELDAMAGMVHAMLCGLQCMIYWGWVASADNWSGGVSRLGPSDPWLYTGTYRHHFHPFIAEPLFLLFSSESSLIVRTFSFLK